MKQAYRHGEILFVKIKSLPKGLEEVKTKEIVKGQTGNSHTFDKGKIYFKNVDDNVFGYFVAKGTSLLHPEHSPNVGDAQIPNGIYELRKQVEFTPSGLQPVID